MNLHRTLGILKKARDSQDLGLLKKTAAPTGLSLPKMTVPKIDKPDLAIPEIPKPPEVPKLKEVKPLVLNTGRGKSKPAFTHEMKTNSPYNEQ